MEIGWVPNVKWLSAKALADVPLGQGHSRGLLAGPRLVANQQRDEEVSSDVG